MGVIYNIDFKIRLKALDLTQKQFAELVGLSYSTVRQVINKPMAPYREREWNNLLNDYESSLQEKAGEDS